MYTRHKPLVTDTLELLIKGRLKDTLFPYVGEMKLADRWGFSCRGPLESVEKLGELNPRLLNLFHVQILRTKP